MAYCLGSQPFWYESKQNPTHSDSLPTDRKKTQERLEDVIEEMFQTSKQTMSEIEKLMERIKNLELEVEILKKRRFGVGEITNIVLSELQ